MATLADMQLTIKEQPDGSNKVRLDGVLPCDEHGKHRMIEEFEVPNSDRANAAGLWLAHVLAVVADRYCPPEPAH